MDEIGSLPEDEVPYSIVGLFHHTHENDEKYHKDKNGRYQWRTLKHNPAKRKHYLRVSKDQVFPVRARRKFTVQYVLEAQKNGHPLTIDDLKD